MLIATWNINGIKARVENVVHWLKAATPDVCCLQEIKAEDASFPTGVLEELGYNVAVHGQKGFNGVAILSKRPFSDVRVRLPGDPSDEQARYVEAVVPTDRQRAADSHDLPAQRKSSGNGKVSKQAAVDGQAYRSCTRTTRPTRSRSCWPAITMSFRNRSMPRIRRTGPTTRCSCRQTREKYGALLGLGLVDALRATSIEGGIFTFWDYQAGSWQKDNGIRIDHILLSPQAADRLRATRIDKHLRAWERPSDHVPMIAELHL